MNPTISLTVASLKMFFRNRQALFFNLFIPFFMMVIFGILDLGSFSEIELGVVDEARNNTSEDFIDQLKRTDVLEMTFGSRQAQITELEDGKLDFLVVIPEGFGLSDGPSKVEGLFNARRPQESQIAATTLSTVLDDLTFKTIGASRLFELESKEVKSRRFEYVDFLVPGIIAMSIMQMGIFNVIFVMVSYRQHGVLRRLQAAPIHPGHFLTGQVITRLIMSVLQTLILLAGGVLIFGFDLQGSFATLVLLAIIGGALFISMGYAISGWAKTEESAAPIANLVTLPMLFLSGVFFSRDNLPGLLQDITDFFPLTYLADAIREVTTEGVGLVQIWGDLLGLAVWLAVSILVATRIFRWE